MTSEQFRDEIGKEIGEFATTTIDPDLWHWFSRRIYYLSGDFAEPKAYQALSALLEQIDKEHGTRGNYFYYLATAPAFFGPIVTQLGSAELLNEDLSREYQAIIAYVVYSQVLSGAEYMDIADQLEIHAKQELDHALTLSRQIDYLGKMPTVTPKPVRTSKDAKEMLRFDLDNENETIRNYRERVRQCEALEEYAMAEQIRQILVQEQDHQIDLATALGVEVPDVSGGPRGRALRKSR